MVLGVLGTQKFFYSIGDKWQNARNSLLSELYLRLGLSSPPSTELRSAFGQRIFLEKFEQ